ncbi:iron(III) transport system substrate-binding protein [Selenomonas ruminantium]|uniref:Iron(III) transport system substrate-binding protein n=2 Tax=Selenomonas ruminantium TaxID=971 RepID=A0A1M6UEC3_SELRU|nr:iron(III) transport system substrate-binding protein [Selenomonas ruminantium]
MAVLACGGCGTMAQEQKNEALIVYSSHPQRFVQPLVDEFERQTGITVRVVHGSTGDLVDRVAQERPVRADVFWGGAISKVEEQGRLFAPYVSSQDSNMCPQFRNMDGVMTRFTDVPGVLLVNVNLLGNREVTGYKDLLAPWLKGRIAFTDPAVSSSAYAHLLNMIDVMGEGDAAAGWNYIQSFGDNLAGQLLPDSQAVCAGVAQGKYAVGCTFEEAAILEVAKGSPVKIIYMEEGVHSVPDGVYIVKNTAHQEAAQAFVEFLVSRETQLYIVRKLHRRSVRQDVPPPDGRPLLPPLLGVDSGKLGQDTVSQAELLVKFKQFCRQED